MVIVKVCDACGKKNYSKNPWSSIYNFCPVCHEDFGKMVQAARALFILNRKLGKVTEKLSESE